MDIERYVDILEDVRLYLSKARSLYDKDALEKAITLLEKAKEDLLEEWEFAPEDTDYDLLKEEVECLLLDMEDVEEEIEEIEELIEEMEAEGFNELEYEEY